VEALLSILLNIWKKLKICEYSTSFVKLNNLFACVCDLKCKILEKPHVTYMIPYVSIIGSSYRIPTQGINVLCAPLEEAPSCKDDGSDPTMQ